MSEMILLKDPIVVLNAPTVVTEIINYSKGIGNAMSESPYFEESASKLVKFRADIQVLDTAEANCSTNPPTASIGARNKALRTVLADMRSLRSDVQLVVDDSPLDAVVIASSANMAIKKAITHGKQKNTAEDGIEEGTVELTGEGAGPHEWRISTDEIAWTLLPSSRTSKTTVENLTLGTVYSFQNRRMLVNNEKSEWSQSVKIRVR